MQSILFIIFALQPETTANVRGYLWQPKPGKMTLKGDDACPCLRTRLTEYLLQVIGVYQFMNRRIHVLIHIDPG